MVIHITFLFIFVNSKNFPDPFKKNIREYFSRKTEKVIENDRKDRVVNFFFPLVKTKKLIRRMAAIRFRFRRKKLMIIRGTSVHIRV